MQFPGTDIHLFQLRGPFEELANIFILLVVLQVVRLIVGLLSAVFVEFCCRSGPLSSHDRKKIASNAWYALYYTGAVVAGTALLYHTDWMRSDIVCSYENPLVSLGTYPWVYIYQCVQVAFYLNYFFAMLTGIDVKRKDQFAFLVHHVVTIFLIIFSRNWGYVRIQLAILVVHDAADPLLHYAKLVKLARPKWSLVPDILLVLFALVFFATRWAFFPAVLIDSCRISWAKEYPLDWTITAPGKFAFLDDHAILGGIMVSFLGVAICFLYVLFTLHLYWGFYILRMAWVKFFEPTPKGGEAKDDVNSDDECGATPDVGPDVVVYEKKEK